MARMKTSGKKHARISSRMHVQSHLIDKEVPALASTSSKNKRMMAKPVKQASSSGVLVSGQVFKSVLGKFANKEHCYGALYQGDEVFSSDLHLDVHTPVDASVFAQISEATTEQAVKVAEAVTTGFLEWKKVPAPKRGELVRLFGNLVRKHKSELAQIITLECGKPIQESLGEVQELIDVCDFAVGLSRQLHGLTIATERPDHRMMEQWHPLGPTLIVTAFNFPMAVWGWNATLALVCGNSLVWKPSEQCPLSALACHSLLMQIVEEQGAPKYLSSVIFGEKSLSEQLVDNKRFPLVSATGSCAMGKAVGVRVAARMGRSLLELGGNNAMIVSDKADLDLAIRAIAFSALGTSGQRCTTLRRLIVHEDVLPDVMHKLQKVYDSVAIGNPFDESNLMGPLISESSMDKMEQALLAAQQQGGVVICGGEHLADMVAKPTKMIRKGYYMTPALVVIDARAPIVMQETFAPILYVHTYANLEKAIEIQNSVSQGLSSAIFTESISEAEMFMSAVGSDCGIANVNIGTSGAEIGGAFGGEKDTGGGRESGSDAWKNYMRRTTNTINYGKELPLAQGIRFDI